MRLQALGPGQCGNGRREIAQRGPGELLHGDDLHVVGDGESAASARGSAGGQHVVGTGGVISGGLGTERPDEDAAGMADFLEQRIVRDAEMFGSESIRQFDGFVERSGHDDRTIPLDGDRGHSRGVERHELCVDMMGDLLGQRLRGGEENGAGVDVVLGLGQHGVGGEESADRHLRQ